VIQYAAIATNLQLDMITAGFDAHS